MKQDPLDVFQGKEICPTCGAIHPRNLSRCPECGIFHNSQILVEREPSLIPKNIEIKSKPIDPGMYSLNPHSEIPDDESEETEVEDNTVSWGGGSADFSMSDDDEESTVLPQNISSNNFATEKPTEEE